MYQSGMEYGLEIHGMNIGDSTGLWGFRVQLMYAQIVHGMYDILTLYGIQICMEFFDYVCQT